MRQILSETTSDMSEWSTDKLIGAVKLIIVENHGQVTNAILEEVINRLDRESIAAENVKGLLDTIEHLRSLMSMFYERHG